MKSPTSALSYAAIAGVTLATAFIAVQGAAQTPAPSGQAQPSPDVTFKVEVNYVEEDVRVLDRAGNFVRGLKEQDFLVTEDGKPQKITTFSAVDIPFVPRERPLYAGPTALPLEPDVASNVQTAEGRIYLILVDDYHISPQRTGPTKALLRQFILEHLGTNDYAAVLVTSGKTDATQDFTQNRQLLLRAVDRFGGQKLPPATLAIMQARQDQEPAADGSQGRSTMGQEDPDEFEREANARSTLRSLGSVAEWMASIRGRRKAIVYFSEGVDDAQAFDMFGSKDYPSGDSRNTNDRQRHFDAVRDATRDAVDAAARSNVQIYSVDPRGLTVGSDDILIGGLPSGAFNPGPESLADEIRASQDNLRQLSEATGGVAAINVNDFRKAFDRIVQENSSYYVIGYYTTNEKRDGKTRTVNIKVAGHPDAQLSYRAKYLGASGKDKTPKTAAKGSDPARETSAQLMEAMANPLPQIGLTMRVSAVPHKGVGKNAALDVVIEALGTDLKFKEGEGLYNDTVSFSVRVFDRQGKSPAGERFDLALKLKPDSYARVMQNGVRVIRTLPLPPGQYGLRIAAQDSVGAKRGTVRFDVDVPDFSVGATSMSGVALTSASTSTFSSWNKSFGDALPAAPTAIREFPTGDELVAFTEVYDNQPTPTHRLDIATTIRADDGKVVFTHSDERSTEELHGAPGAFGYMVRIPLTGWARGLYVLTIETKSRLGNAEPVSRAIPFRVR